MQESVSSLKLQISSSNPFTRRSVAVWESAVRESRHYREPQRPYLGDTK